MTLACVSEAESPPHAAWYSPDGARDCREKAARTVINYLTEGTIRNCVNEQFLKQGDAS